MAVATRDSGSSRTRRSRTGLRAVLRFAAAVMTTSGVLLLADAGVTLAWQEPVSAIIAMQQQSQLEDQLAEARPLSLRTGGDDGFTEQQLNRLAERHERRTDEGDAWGRIELPSLGRDYVVVQGTDAAPLRKGPGHYPDTSSPGQGGTTAIAGHRTTYLAPFRTIDQLSEGDEIVIDLPWARFTYAFEQQRIVEPTQTSVVRDVGRERLVLTACHPLYSAAERIVVFAELKDVEPV